MIRRIKHNRVVRETRIPNRTMLFGILALTVLGITGCAKTEVEKMPVTVADEVSVSDPIIEDDETMTGDISDDTKDTTNNPSENTKDDTQGNDQDNALPQPIQEDKVEDPSEGEASDEIVTMTVTVEGMEEEIKGKRFKSTLGYQIIYDIDRFQLADIADTEEEFDSFTVENPNPELYPYVYLNIYRHDKATYEGYNTGKNNNTWKTIMIGNAYYLDEVTIGSHKAHHYHTSPGNEWNSIVKDYYFIEHGDYYYIIDTQYFLEAAEGFGARMMAMMNTIEFE